ncbi:hypothetical protein Tco_0710912 [Tanacetum coccineum]
MASNPEQIRLTVLTKLQEALDEEAILEEQILASMHRFTDRFTDRREEINNLMVLHDHPLIDYENVIVVRVDNRPPMLDKTQYSSWASHMLLYIKGKENGKLFIDSVLNGPFKYETVTVPRTQTTPAIVKDRTYDELTDAEKLHESCDIKATNIVLQGLPRDIYNLVNHHEESKHIAWRDNLFVLLEGYVVNGARSNATGVNRTGRTNTAGQAKKVMLAEAPKSGMVLDEEHMAFLVDNGDTVTTGQQSQKIPTPTTFQTNDLDAFESDYDEAPSTSVVLMDKLSSYDSEVLSEVPLHNNYLENHVIEQNVQETQYSEQPAFDNNTYIDITNDSNMTPYEQYLKENENTVVQDTLSSAHQDAMTMSMIKEMNNQVAKCNKVDK